MNLGPDSVPRGQRQGGSDAHPKGSDGEGCSAGVLKEPGPAASAPPSAPAQQRPPPPPAFPCFADRETEAQNQASGSQPSWLLLVLEAIINPRGPASSPVES